MTKPSSYDELYEKYWDSDLKKSGTRYERLTAFVFQALQDSNTVIHDIKLLGESDVKHQIDVTIEKNSERKRVIIECKDYDISGKKVGLGIIRDFWGVIDDVHPDEAIIITCNGFTSEAMKYAKSKNIKLAVLREFRESDWEGRIKTICVTMHILHITEPKVSMHFDNQENVDKLTHDLSEAGIGGYGVRKGQPVYLNLPDGRKQFNEYVEKVSTDHPRNEPGPVELKINLAGSTIEVENRGGVPIAGLALEFEVVHSEKFFEVTSDKIAKLILSNLNESDIIIFEQDLVRLRINGETGEIIA